MFKKEITELLRTNSHLIKDGEKPQPGSYLLSETSEEVCFVVSEGPFAEYPSVCIMSLGDGIQGGLTFNSSLVGSWRLVDSSLNLRIVVENGATRLEVKNG